MLIKALCDYYDLRKQESEEVIPNGYESQKIDYMVLLNEEGDVVSIDDIRSDENIKLKNDKVKTKKVPTEKLLPERSKKTGIASALIEHRPLYIFGLNYDKDHFTVEDSTNKAKNSHKAFIDKNIEFFEELTSPACKAYYNFMKKWIPEEQVENKFLLSLGKEYSGSYFSFALEGDYQPMFIQDDPEFVKKYNEHIENEKTNNSESNTVVSICPVMGEALPTARIHDKINFPGGNTSGCGIVGMNESAYESFTKTQSYNSNISEIAMKKYTSAFNELLGNKKHTIKINNMVVVFFALKANDDNEADLVSLLFGTDSSSDEQNAKLKEIMNCVKLGNAIDYDALEVDPKADCYIAGFTPNSSRICQKFIIHNSFGGIINNFLQFQRDFEFEGSNGKLSFGRIARELVSPKAKNPEVPPPLMAGIVKAAIEGTDFPIAMLQNVIIRIKTDHDQENKHYVKFNPVRAGIIKACINRRARKSNKEEVIKVSLDVNEKNQAYLCGRLFAVLEKIQQDASGGNLNTTIVDSYYASASQKPATVFPRLMNLSKNHLKKIKATREGAYIYYSRLISEIFDGIETEYPNMLDLVSQGIFSIGYEHQRTELYKSKKDKEESQNNIEEE